MRIYVFFCSLFCTILVTGNLLFQKFVSINLFDHKFEISAGVLFYPVTFLISDLVTEFYGQKNAKFMVNIAFICSIVVLLLVWIADSLNASEWSSVNNEMFHKVFNAYGIGMISSIIANYFGQIIDIRIFDYLKILTNGTHLWLRNNISTMVGQLVDSIIVVGLLCICNVLSSEQFWSVMFSSYMFKLIAAILDTPFCYLGHYLIKNSNIESLINGSPIKSEMTSSAFLRW